jgi:hypothetical protein
MILLQGEPEAVVSWAQRGLVPVHVTPLDDWTAVLPAGPSLAMAPYDDTLRMFAGRPVSPRLRSAIGLFAVDGKAVISAHASGWHSTQTWFVWSPGEGVVRPRRLVAGSPGDLTAAAGTRDRTACRGVRDVLSDGGGDAQGVLGDILAVLALPGADLLDGPQDPAAAPGSILVEPAAQHVARFGRIVKDEARHRAELEED